MDHSDPDGSPLARKRTSNRRKFVREVYKPSNRKLPPNRRLWPCENLNDLSEDTSSSKSIRPSVKPRVALENVKTESKEGNNPKSKQHLKPSHTQSKSVKLTDKSNAQKEVRLPSRITRSSAMTNTRVGRSKMEVLDEEETTKNNGPKEPEIEEDAESFLDVSADHRIKPIFRTSKPTQQSLGADVTFTFDTDKHAQALADCSPIPRVPSGSNRDSKLESALLPPTHPFKSSRRIVTPVPKSLVVPSPTKKRTRRLAPTRSSKIKAPKGPLSDDPMMI